MATDEPKGEEHIRIVASICAQPWGTIAAKRPWKLERKRKSKIRCVVFGCPQK
jgi:hypothetical protein